MQHDKPKAAEGISSMIWIAIFVVCALFWLGVGVLFMCHAGAACG